MTHWGLVSQAPSRSLRVWFGLVIVPALLTVAAESLISMDQVVGRPSSWPGEQPSLNPMVESRAARRSSNTPSSYVDDRVSPEAW
ncbi:hypothetical protein [Amycolatopsis pigmentata]|uniref:Uncharacterized protein n=1 Tax=Amycolatopsis pigmentata TaxID=450801 RepID=A0ABW5FS43_9PSEU